MNERIKKIADSIPKKMFFDPSFEASSRNGLLADIVAHKGKSLKREQEYQIFRKYNYLKYRLLKLTVGFKETEEVPAPKPCPPVNMERLGEKSVLELEGLLARMAEARNFIIQSNVGLVFGSVNRYFSYESFERDEFVSNAYFHLIKAIDCFDYRKGFKFSTYCVNVMGMNLYRDMESLKKVQSRLGFSDSLLCVVKSDDSSFVKENEEYTSKMIDKVFEKIRNRFRDPDQKIKVLKYYHGIGTPSMSTRDISKKMNISVTRVNQIKTEIRSVVAASLSYDP
jgi:RNA polymerase sigma factor (sigma-70 family)